MLGTAKEKVNLMLESIKRFPMFDLIKKTVKTPLSMHWSIVFLYATFVYALNDFWLATWLFLGSLISVLIHEWSHVYFANKYGYETKKIVFMALGAAAMIDLEKHVKDHKNEALLALAGPVSSFVLGMLLVPLFMIWRNDFLAIMIALNVLMAIFNAIPVYPLDGGRVFSSLLSLKLGAEKALKVVRVINYVVLIPSLVYYLYNFSVWMIAIILFVGIVSHLEIKKRLSILEGSGSTDVGNFFL